MTQFLLAWRMPALAVVLALLSACGGGGGGGGGGSTTTGGDGTNQPSNPPLGPDVANAYLPTGPDVRWTYNGNTQIRFLPADTSSGAYVHGLLYPTGGKEYFVTAADSISLSGLYLPSITVGDGVTYTAEIRFDSALPIFRNDAPAGTSQGLSGSGSIDISPTYGRHSLSYSGYARYAGEETVSTTLGGFKAKRIEVSLSLATTVQGTVFTIPYNVTFWLAKDVGMVRRDQENVSYVLSAVNGLNIVGSGPIDDDGLPPDDDTDPGDDDGGSGSGTPPDDDDDDSGGNDTPPFVLDVDFDLPKLFAEYDVGDSRSMSVTGTINLSINAGAYVRMTDTGAAIDPSWSSFPNYDGTFSMRFQPLPNLPAGVHTGNVSIQFCKASLCAEEYAGSPVTLPYEVRVHAITSDLKPLAALAGAGDWLEYRGSAAHTGAVPATLDVQDFSRRWQWLPQDTDINKASPVVTYQGRAFFSTNHGHMGISYANGRYVNALSEDTGAVEWSNAIPCCSGMNPPAVANGRVYTAIGGSGMWSLQTFDATSGASLWTSGFAGQWSVFLAPTVLNDIVVQHSGYNNGGLAAFDATDGSVLWSDSTLWDTHAPGAVAADASNIYSVMVATIAPSWPDSNDRPMLYVIDQATGTIVRSIYPASPSNASIGSRTPTPVLSGPNSVLLGYTHGWAFTPLSFHVEKMDTAAGSTVWSVDYPIPDTTIWIGNNMSDNQPGLDPVVIGGVVYVVNPAQQKLEARRESDGVVLWSWAPPAVDQSPLKYKTSLVATSNLVFIAADRFVYAIDTTTGATAWRYWNTGELAISANGILYVVRAGGIVEAINLH